MSITCDRLAIDSTTNIYTGVKLYRLQDNTTRSVLLSTHCIGAIGRGKWMLICYRMFQAKVASKTRNSYRPQTLTEHWITNRFSHTSTT